MHRTSETQVLVKKERRFCLLLVQERSIRILFHEGFMDRAMAMRAKARSELLAS